MRFLGAVLIFFLFIASACKSSGRTDAPSIFSSDETAEAGKVVASANEDLTKIKVLYKDNEDKREEIKKAKEVDDAKKVRELARDVSIKNEIDEDLRLGVSRGIGGTPAMFLMSGGRTYPVNSTVSFGILRRSVEQLLTH